MKEGSFHTSTLRVVNVSATLDYAVFSCIARNSLGEDKLDIQLVSTSTVSAYISIILHGCVFFWGTVVPLQWQPQLVSWKKKKKTYAAKNSAS